MDRHTILTIELNYLPNNAKSPLSAPLVPHALVGSFVTFKIQIAQQSEARRIGALIELVVHVDGQPLYAIPFHLDASDMGRRSDLLVATDLPPECRIAVVNRTGCQLGMNNWVEASGLDVVATYPTDAQTPPDP